MPLQIVIALLVLGSNPAGTPNNTKAEAVLDDFFTQHEQAYTTYESDCINRIHISPLPPTDRDRAYCEYYTSSLD